MDVNEFFDMAEGMVREVFDANGRWHDGAVAWTGRGREIATIYLHQSGEYAPSRLRSIITGDGYAAFAVAYEGRVSVMDEDADGSIRPCGEAATGVEGGDELPPEHALFIHMEAEDGTTRTRVFEIVAGTPSRLGRRVGVLEAAISPFSGVYELPRMRH